MMCRFLNNNLFPFTLRLMILVCGLVITHFRCYADEFKFTRTCLVRVGGTGLTSGDENTIAKYDLAIMQRFLWNDINGNSWEAIKAINPNTQIYLYQLGSEINDNTDGNTIENLNNLGRWNNRRPVPGTNVNEDNTDFFLLDSSSSRIYNTGYANSWRMDIGLADYQDYWLDATVSDIVNQDWTADGVFMDNCLTLCSGANSVPAKYSTNALWITAMHSFINAETAGLHAAGQKTFCNRGGIQNS